MLITENQLRSLIRNILREEISEEDGLIGEEEKADAEAVAAIEDKEEYEFEGEKFKVNISSADALQRVKEKELYKKNEFGALGKIMSVASGLMSLKYMVDQMSTSK